MCNLLSRMYENARIRPLCSERRRELCNRPLFNHNHRILAIEFTYLSGSARERRLMPYLNLFYLISAEGGIMPAIE